MTDRLTALVLAAALAAGCANLDRPTGTTAAGRCAAYQAAAAATAAIADPATRAARLAVIAQAALAAGCPLATADG